MTLAEMAIDALRDIVEEMESEGAAGWLGRLKGVIEAPAAHESGEYTEVVTGTLERLVYWIAQLAMNNPEYNKAKVGDIAVEVTHLVATCKQRKAFPHALGEIISIRTQKDLISGNGETVYTIRTIEGREQEWTNAMFALVEPAHLATGRDGGEE